MSYGYVYIVKDHLTKKVYIGQHICNGCENYYGSGTVITRVVKKWKHHLEKRIIGYCDTKEKVLQRVEQIIVINGQTNKN